MHQTRPAARTPRTQPEPGVPPTLRLYPADAFRSVRGTYVSWDEIERADARTLGYESVCQHPNEVGVLDADDELVIDGNNILFGDFDAAVRVGIEAVRNGATVGVHTYNPDHLPLAPLVALPGVVVARTHRDLRAAMKRLRAAS